MLSLRSSLLCACLLHSAEAFLPTAPQAYRPSAFPRIAARSSRGNSAALALRSSAEDGAGSVDRRAALQGLTLLALGVPTASSAKFETRNGAGLDVNKKGRFEDADISTAIDMPVQSWPHTLPPRVCVHTLTFSCFSLQPLRPHAKLPGVLVLCLNPPA